LPESIERELENTRDEREEKLAEEKMQKLIERWDD
jgi:hypothetical protein